MHQPINSLLRLFSIAVLFSTGLHFAKAQTTQRPNILWLYVEDMSTHLSCYGETTIRTPNIDRLAREGIRYEAAFTTSPVCSSSRSALISGMYQGTLGAHNHRSQGTSGKPGGNVLYYDSYELPEGIKLLPQLFQEAGYFTALGELERSEAMDHDLAKTDYNFVWDKSIYDDDDWSGRKPGQPFFAQIQLRGGKARDAEVARPVNPEEVDLPPYYPDHPIVREAWAEYLDAIRQLDVEIGQIWEALEHENLLDNTVIFFFSDHGISNARGKQFAYDEGIQIPLIVRLPQQEERGLVNRDLINHLDIAASSLDLAGIEIPGYMHGQSLFSADYQPRSYIYAGRDRCDETIDVIRAVRTPRFKYIRNYYRHRPHAQPNRYRDGYPEMQLMRQWYAEGRLDSLQASLFHPERPAEELYDIEKDPHETNNLADEPEYRKTLLELRRTCAQAMDRRADLGLIPEPVLEEWGKRYGNKYYIFSDKRPIVLLDSVRTLLSADDLEFWVHTLSSGSAPLRYWAATELGYTQQRSEWVKEALRQRLYDPSATVRVAAAEALIRLDAWESSLPVLAAELENLNALLRLYAIAALERVAPEQAVLREALEERRKDNYEYVRRIAHRLTGGRH